MGKNRKEKSVIFISYHEGIPESRKIAVELEQFFKKWGHRCKLIIHSRTTKVTEDAIMEELGKSTWLLQLFTTDPESSKWMERERLWFEGKHHGKLNLKDAIKVLFTKDTPREDSSFNNLNAQAELGKLHLIQIDDPDQAQKTLSSIVFDKYFEDDQIGDIVLPECCRKPPDPDEIQLQALELFINNFRQANRRGLVSVYPDKWRTLDQIKSHLEQLNNGDSVRMMGFTLHRYVVSDVKKEGGTGKYFKAAINRGATARLLLLDQNCPAAIERVKIENPEKDFPNTVFYNDSVEVNNSYKEEKYRDCVLRKFYKTPYVGLVLFKDEIFVELYHLGHDGEKDKSGMKETICGRVPVLVIKKDSPFYKLFDSHFERVWEIAEDEMSKS
ncbi:MAG: hypothetical protein NT096_10565 [Proteobacteria bacterium]|nr:hypothetical protein [Pseudomonadota bacterium]